MRALGAYAVWAALAVAALAIVRAQRRRPAAWQPPALATVAAASVMAFAVVSWGRATPLGDFNKAYYPAGAMILSDPSRLYECDVSNLCFVNLPLVALLFTPLTMMARLPAQLLFTAIGAVAVAAAAWLTIRELDARGADRSAIVAAFALNGPLLYSIRLGNLTHVLLPCLAIAIASLAGGREARAGVLFAVLTVIKPPFLLFLPYLVLRRRTTAAVAFAATVTLVVTASMALFGTELHKLWLATFIGPFAARPVAAYNVQSISGLVAHFTMPGHLTDWTPLEAPAMFNAARYVLLLAVTAIAAIALFARGAPRDATAHRLELNCVLVLMLLASPLTWSHYYAFVVPALAAYASRRTPVLGAWWMIVPLAAMLVSLPAVLPLLSAPIPAALVERVLISHYTWGGILLLGCLCASRLAAARGQGTSTHDVSSRELPHR